MKQPNALLKNFAELVKRIVRKENDRNRDRVRVVWVPYV